MVETETGVSPEGLQQGPSADVTEMSVTIAAEHPADRSLTAQSLLIPQTKVSPP